MNTLETLGLAAAWIAYWKASENSAEREALFWVSEREWEPVRRAPHDAWQVIVAILDKDDSIEIQEVLSAGPLEDLLAYHGESMISTVEAEAIKNPKIASLLGGVWQNNMQEEVWARVQAVWDRRGWDGEPEA